MYYNGYKNNSVGYHTGNVVKSTGVTTITALEPADSLLKLKAMMWRKPTYTDLEFTEEAWIKMNCYTHLAGTFEITGFGKVEGNKVTDIKILKQIVKSAEVDVDEEAQLIFMRTIPFEELHLWVLDWHSHVNMSAFMSSTDTTNYDKRYDVMKKSFPALVFNKRQEVFCKEWYGDGQCGDDIKVYQPDKITLTEEEFENIYEQCYTDVENLCSKSTTTYNSSKDTKDHKCTVKGYENWTQEQWKNSKWNKEKLVWELCEDDEEPPKMSKNKRKQQAKMIEKAKRKEGKFKDKIVCQACGDELDYLIEIKHKLCTGCMSEEQLYEAQICEDGEQTQLWSEEDAEYNQAWDVESGEIRSDFTDYSSDTYIYDVSMCTICGENAIDMEDEDQVTNGCCNECLVKYTDAM